MDEQTVPFKGTSSLKQYNPTKLQKWGYKLFMLCDSNGLTHNFEVYTGRILPTPTLPDIGASSNVVLRLTEHVSHQNQKKLLIYFDNWYSSPSLLVTLSNIGSAALRIIRKKRFSRLEFLSDKDMKIEGRGCYEEKKRLLME